MNKITNAIIIAATALLVTACGTAKKATTLPDANANTTTETSTDPFTDIVSHLGAWQTLQVGGKMTIDAGTPFTSGVQVRMVRGEVIQISLRPLLGIEVGRLLITGDSIYGMDKVHKRYIAEKASILTAGVPINVSTIQDIFLGRPFIIGKGTLGPDMKQDVTVHHDGKVTIITPTTRIQGYGYEFAFNKSHQIVSLNIVPASSSTPVYQVRYSNIKATAAGNIAHTMRADGNINKKKLALDLDYNNIDWNGNVKIDHNIPANYTRVSARELLSLFTQ